jgi:hypothetical protein
MGSPYPENAGYVVGQKFTAQGQVNSAYNGSFTITAITSATITANNISAPGSAWTSGGSPTVSMVCNNSADAITGTAFATNTVTLPAYSAPASYGVKSLFQVFTPTTAPNLGLPALYYNGTQATGYSTTFALGGPRSNQQGSVDFTAAMPSSGVLYASTDSQTLSSTGYYANTQPTHYLTTSASAPLTLGNVYWSASGLGGTLVLTYASGGTSCTNGTQAVTGFNGGGTGGAGTITVSGGVPTGSITWTNTGYGYTSIPTTGTVATCTGTTTFTNTGALGGAQGTALRLLWLNVRQQ